MCQSFSSVLNSKCKFNFTGEKVYPTGTTFRLDTCTNCTCTDTTAVCDRISCPPLECEPMYQAMTQGSCCPKCVEPELPKTQCVSNDVVYKVHNQNPYLFQSVVTRWVVNHFGHLNLLSTILNAYSKSSCHPILLSLVFSFFAILRFELFDL